MTQENKQLLLKDLCTRLPYGTIYHRNDGANIELREVDIKNGTLNYTDNLVERECKPYLRPMSSMTEEEFEKLKEYSGLKYEQLDLASFQNGTYKCLDFYLSEVPSDVVILVFDWLNAHHFDYRGLISMGFALEAPEDMYGKKNNIMEE